MSGSAPAAAERQRRFVAAMTRAMLVLTTAIAVTFAGTALGVWTLITPGAGYTVLLLTPLVLGTGTLLAVVIKLGQGGGRLRLAPSGAGAGTDAGTGGAVNRDDDRFYKLGLFYFNPEDPALWVPKRFGVGWTVNMARPAVWIAVATVAAVNVVLALVH